MNTKHHNKKWNIFLIFLSLFLSITIIDACRKKDHITNKPDDPENPTTPVGNPDKFFDVPASAPQVLKDIAMSMKKHNDTLNFANDLIKKAGYPRWDKAIVQTTIKGNSTKGTNKQAGVMEGEEEEDTTIAFVPFTLANSTSAVLTVAINVFPTKDTAYNILYPQHYKAYGFEAAPVRNAWNARKVFKLFTDFDHSIFGIDSFEVRDGRIGG